MAPVKLANVMSTSCNDLGFPSTLVSHSHICHQCCLTRPLLFTRHLWGRPHRFSCLSSVHRSPAPSVLVVSLLSDELQKRRTQLMFSVFSFHDWWTKERNNCYSVLIMAHFYEISIKTIWKGVRGVFLRRGPNWFALFHNVYVIIFPCHLHLHPVVSRANSCGSFARQRIKEWKGNQAPVPSFTSSGDAAHWSGRASKVPESLLKAGR